MDSNTTKDRKREQENKLVISYMTLRNLIGFCGMLLPIYLLLFTHKEGGLNIQPSISDYYYTNNGDVLVAVLCVLASFLLTYNGYKWTEKIWTTLAAICAIGVAFSPTASGILDPEKSVHVPNEYVPGIGLVERHIIFATIFFISLSIISIFYFTKTDGQGNITKKNARNKCYVICGWVMIICVIIIAIYKIIKANEKDTTPVVFIFETIALESFGFSWIVKGETLWPENMHYIVFALRKMKAIANKEIEFDEVN